MLFVSCIFMGKQRTVEIRMLFRELNESINIYISGNIKFNLISEQKFVWWSIEMNFFLYIFTHSLLILFSCKHNRDLGLCDKFCILWNFSISHFLFYFIHSALKFSNSKIIQHQLETTLWKLWIIFSLLNWSVQSVEDID